jgi:hypothetical protein
MPITFACSCGKKYSAPDEAAGRQTTCKACGAAVKIPGPKAPTPAKGSPAVKPGTAVRKPATAPPKPKPADDLDFANEAPKPEKSEYDFADDGPKAQGEVFQGPSPQADQKGTGRAGPAAALYGEAPGGKKDEKKSGGLIGWLVILGVILVIAGVLKFVVLK